MQTLSLLPRIETVKVVHEVGTSDVTVSVGQTVTLNETLATEPARRPSVVVDLTEQLRRPAEQIAAQLPPLLNRRVEEGEVLLTVGGPLGLGRRQAVAPVAGVVRDIHEEGGTLMIAPNSDNEQCRSMIAGTVTGAEAGRVEVTTETTVIAGVHYVTGTFAGRLLIHGDGAGPDAGEEPVVVAIHGSPSEQQLDEILDRFTDRRVAFVVPSIRATVFEKFARKGTAIFVVRGWGNMPFGSETDDETWKSIKANSGEHAVLLGPMTDADPRLVLPNRTGVNDPSPQLSSGNRVVASNSIRLALGTILEVREGKTLLPSGLIGESAIVAFDDGTIGAVDILDVRVIGRLGSQASA